MSTPVVKYGWVIQDQAAVVPGMGFGPGWLKGSKRTGPVMGGYHNLLGKDIVFQAKGKYALGAIVQQMLKMTSVKVRSGIREGMMIEKWEESEYGGGMDEVKVKATKEDIVRIDYHLYALPHVQSAYSFTGLLNSFVSQATGFIPSNAGVAGVAFRDVYDGVVSVVQKVMKFSEGHKSDLRKAMKADKVLVVLTSQRMVGKMPLLTHKHTHSMPTLAKEIGAAVLAGK